MLRDLVLALRRWRSQPVYFSVSAAALALAFALNTVTALVYASVALWSPPFEKPADILVARDFRHTTTFFTPYEAARVADAIRPVGRAEAYRVGVGARSVHSLTWPGGQADVVEVTPGTFDLLGVRPLRGRLFDTSTAIRGHPQVLVSERVWRRAFGARGDALGRSIPISGRLRTVVGVLPSPTPFPYDEVGAWIPLDPRAADATGRADVSLVARPRVPGAGPALAGAIRAAALGGSAEAGVPVQTLEEASRASDIGLFALLQAGVCGVFIMMCTNLGTLALGRAIRQEAEHAVRATLGASPWQLARPLVMEAALLAAVGAVFGYLVSSFARRALADVLPIEFIALRLGNAPDGHWVAYTVACLATAFVCLGGIPLAALARVRGGAGTIQRAVGTSAGRRPMTLQRVAVACQIGVALTLTAGCAWAYDLLLEERRAADAVQASRLLVARVAGGGADPTGTSGAARIAVQQLANEPGVVATAVVSRLPGGTGRLGAEGDARAVANVQAFAVSGPLAPVLGLPLVAGRDLTTEDGLGGSAAVVTREFARRYGGGSGVVGRPLRLDGPGQRPGFAEVVGVIDDPAPVFPFLDASRGAHQAAVFVAAVDAGPAGSWVVGRTRGVLARTLAPAVTARVWGDTGTTPRGRFVALDEALADRQRSTRWYASAFGAFLALAAALAGTGAFGVAWALATLRRRELAIRLAVGATPSRVAVTLASDLAAVLGGGAALGALGWWYTRATFAAIQPGAALTGVTPVAAAAFPAVALAALVSALAVPVAAVVRRTAARLSGELRP